MSITFFALGRSEIGRRVFTGQDAINLPGLNAASTQASLVSSATVLLAQQRVHPAFRPLGGLPLVTAERRPILKCHIWVRVRVTQSVHLHNTRWHRFSFRTACLVLFQFRTLGPSSNGELTHFSRAGPLTLGPVGVIALLRASRPFRPVGRVAVFGYDARLVGHWQRLMRTQAGNDTGKALSSDIACFAFKTSSLNEIQIRSF